MSADKAACPTCGTALGGAGWCARCALDEVLDAEAGAATAGGLFAVPGHVVQAELGRGAAGIVYRARQLEPARDVALKILRPHEAGSAESRARFRLEATTVAGLDHPAILPVLSVGEHDGLPYFTMKLCAGGSLAEHGVRLRGAWREIAALVATLADAIHHAHQRGVLHRDLKPGNILFDEAQRPFVSDFGIAKRLAEAEPSAPVTRPLAVFGTPGYVAPEVRQHGAAAATQAADIHGLGAILEELLTGEPPPEVPRLTPPPAPRACPRDLAVIAAKCLQPEPTTRYASAAALADDLRAWLDGRPIAARPLSAMGQARAWVRRNPALAGVSAAALLALVAVAVVATVSAIRLGREQRATLAALAQVEAEHQRALTESATSRAIADFLQDDLLGQASPDRQPDRDLRLRTVLDRAAKGVGERFAARPLVEAALRLTLGNTYGSLGDHAAMEAHLRRAVELFGAHDGAESKRTPLAQRGLALALLRQGKLREAEPIGRAAFAGLTRVFGTDQADTLFGMSILSEICDGLGRADEARELTARALEISRRSRGPEAVPTLMAMNDLASLLSRQQRLAEAEALGRQAWELRKKVLGPENPATLVSMSNLAGYVLRLNRPAEAETLYAELAAIDARVLGADHPYTLTARGGLALAQQANGNFTEAVAIQRQVLAARTRVFGADNASTFNSVVNLAGALLDAGRYEEAETHYRALHAARLRVSKPGDPAVLTAASGLAFTLRLRGRLDEAEALEEATLAARARALGPEHRDTLVSMGGLAAVRLLRGRSAEAEPLLSQRAEISRRVLGTRNPDTQRALDRLGAYLLAAARFADAEPLLRESLAARSAAAPAAWATAATRSLLGAALAGLGNFTEAEPLLREGYSALAAHAPRIPAPYRNEVSEAGARLVAFYAARGLTGQADAWREKIAAAEATTSH